MLRNHCRPYYKAKALGATETALGPYRVPDLCAAYEWPTGLAGGGVIAIVELQGGWVQSDMDLFFKFVGQPLPQITDVSVDGSKNDPNQSLNSPNDPDYEVAMDIQIAAASYYVATGKPAVIRVYWAPEIPAAVKRAMEDGCDVCSISWGSDEAHWGKSDAEAMEAVAGAAVDAGMIVVAAAGDNDSSDGGHSPANVDLPAACPHVISCGGTTKTADQETVWNQDPGRPTGQGTGGGYSTIFPMQDFQIGAPPAPVGAPGRGRMVPDVCAVGDMHTGYRVFVHGQETGGGGTSAVAPLYSGLFAAFGKKLGYVLPRLWQNQHCFNDVIHGENGAYSAAPGPDPCSGIGSPIGAKLAELFAQESARI